MTQTPRLPRATQWGQWFLRPIALCDLFSTTSETRASEAADADRHSSDTEERGLVRHRFKRLPTERSRQRCCDEQWLRDGARSDKSSVWSRIASGLAVCPSGILVRTPKRIPGESARRKSDKRIRWLP